MQRIFKGPNMNEIFSKDLSGEMVSPDEPGYDELINAIWDTMKLAAELNTGYRTPDEVREYLSRITGQKIDPSVTLLPPFYVDFGKNIRMGKRCWIQQGCTFFDRGGITLGNDVFIAPKVNLITINHDHFSRRSFLKTAVAAIPITGDRYNAEQQRQVGF